MQEPGLHAMAILRAMSVAPVQQSRLNNKGVILSEAKSKDLRFHRAPKCRT
jgi:hypothetical protein